MFLGLWDFSDKKKVKESKKPEGQTPHPIQACVCSGKNEGSDSASFLFELYKPEYFFGWEELLQIPADL